MEYRVPQLRFIERTPTSMSALGSDRVPMINCPNHEHHRRTPAHLL
jgi:hypothetical protein